jgi:hypothetical protein
MAIAQFKDLVLDAADPARLGAFWAAALDRTWTALDSGDGVLRGPTPGHSVWINRVPEPLAVKNRVHFDVHARELGELERLGARLVEPHERWTVMADPEGTLFCAFLRAQLPADRMHGLVVDSVDAVASATWWAGVYGAPLEVHDPYWATVTKIPGMPVLTMDFVAVPEPKTVKNRIHWDVQVASVADLLDAGGRLVRAGDDEIRWHVLADPEGNEFCTFEQSH